MIGRHVLNTFQTNIVIMRNFSLNNRTVFNRKLTNADWTHFMQLMM